MDNNSWSASCQSCGTNLNTEEQRVFNQKLWEKRRAEREEEEKALAQAKAQSAVSGIDPGTQRKLAEQIARDVAQSTRQRMDLESMRDSFSSGSMGYGRFNLFSWGFERLPPQVRTLLVVGALAVPLILMAFQRTRGLGFLGFFVVCIVLVRLWLTS